MASLEVEKTAPDSPEQLAQNIRVLVELNESKFVLYLQGSRVDSLIFAIKTNLELNEEIAATATTSDTSLTFILEIYNDDFQEYVRIDENTIIKNFSRIRIKSRPKPKPPVIPKLEPPVVESIKEVTPSPPKVSAVNGHQRKQSLSPFKNSNQENDNSVLTLNGDDSASDSGDNSPATRNASAKKKKSSLRKFSPSAYANLRRSYRRAAKQRVEPKKTEKPDDAPSAFFVHLAEVLKKNSDFINKVTEKYCNQRKGVPILLDKLLKDMKKAGFDIDLDFLRSRFYYIRKQYVLHQREGARALKNWKYYELYKDLNIVDGMKIMVPMESRKPLRARMKTLASSGKITKTV